MKPRDEQGQVKGSGRDRGIDRKRRRRRGDGLSRSRDEPLPDQGTRETRAAVWLPLLDTELLSLDIHRSWHALYPDADER